MKGVFKQFMSVGITAGLVGSSLLLPISGYAETKAKVGVSSLVEKSPLLQQKYSQSKHKGYSEDTLTVKYNRAFSYSELKKMGVTLEETIPELNYMIVKVKDKDQVHKAFQAFSEHTKTLSVSPSTLYTPLDSVDPKSGSQYLHKMLKTEEAQKLAGKHKITVAVVDQGVDPKHPDLKQNLLPSYNAVNPMNQGNPDFHGTHVAGIIGAVKDNGVGGYGVNPNVKILPIDVFNRGWGAYDFAIAKGILKAVDKGADVINLSIGGPVKSPLIEEAINKALDKNIVVVAAAGNTGDDMVSYPAGYEGVISVGSINEKKELATTSSYGPSVDIVAPGDQVYSTLYDYEKGSTFYSLSGTSMATPVVSGVVSLMLSKYPTLTPAQIEYILEHTADDLGEKGFDIKFANGLVNPVKALSYDPKKVPGIVTTELTYRQKMEKATVLEGKEEKGYFTKPSEKHYFKVNVSKGENVQLTLKGATQYDYKIDGEFTSIFGDKEEFEVNKVREGKTEGKLFTAPFSGTLLLTIKDVNGSYDDSKEKKSHYALNAEITKDLPLDQSTLDEPYQVPSVPYDSKDNPFYFIGDGQDDDYYQFQVEEDGLVNINLSEVAGVDSSISVYMEEDFQMYKELEQMKEMDDSEEYFMDPMYYANSNGISESESLTFKAEPGVTYYAKVSNKAGNLFGFFDFMMNPELMEQEKEAPSSLNPYSLSIDTKVLPLDEDIFPDYGIGKWDEENPEEEMVDEVKEQRVKIAELYEEDKPANDEQDMVQMLKDGALPYEVGATDSGFLQMQEDEDWFTITPDQSGVVEFLINQKIKDKPLVELYKLSTSEDRDKEEGIQYLESIGENIKWGMSDVELTSSLYTVLEKGETYFLKVQADFFNGSIPFDGYSISSSYLSGKVSDQYEPNNEWGQAVPVPSRSFSANFASPRDLDTYYYSSKKDEIMGVSFTRGTAPKSMREKLPKELFADVYGMVAFVEDKNNNKRLDEDEYVRAQGIDSMTAEGDTFGSVKVGKNKNYFVIVEGYIDSYVPFSLNPYKLTLHSLDKKDEDSGSVVKNNKPSKPLSLSNITGKLFTGKGYLNTGVPYGDEDWYTVKVPRNTKVKFKLETGFEVDGEISIYQNGKAISVSDYYALGDAEVTEIPLSKGTYYVKVKDVQGNASLTPYEIKVYMH